jgi:hypothetical protein
MYTWLVRREPTSDGLLDADGAWGAVGGDSPDLDAGHVQMPHAVMTEVVQDAVQGVRASRTEMSCCSGSQSRSRRCAANNEASEKLKGGLTFVCPAVGARSASKGIPTVA